MKYFRLEPDCFLIEGRNEGVIYDIYGRRIFLLDEGSHRVIRRCEDNEPLGEWLGKSGMRFLKRLCEAGLGRFDSEPAYVERLLLHSPLEWKGFCMKPPRYRRMDWVIIDHCDLNCRFCGQGENTIPWQGCQTCLLRAKGEDRLWFPDDPEDFIAEIAALGISLIHFRGGNPLLGADRLKRLVHAVGRHSPLRVIITTPGTGMEIESILALCREGPVQFNIVIFGVNEDDCRTVCGRGDVWKRQKALIDSLREKQLPLFITALLTHSTSHTRSQIYEFVDKHWGGGPGFAEVCTHNHPLMAGFHLSHIDEGQVKMLSPWRSLAEFYFRIRNNTCTAGNFEVGPDSKVRPCIGIDRLCGDVLKGGLRQALSGPELYAIWELSKADVQPCCECPLRYSCADCSVFELKGAEDQSFKEAYCPFHPNLGESKAYDRNWYPHEFVKRLSIND
jgi:sulfatase maturation enzyme AslB (radical SAM superfamily)